METITRKVKVGSTLYMIIGAKEDIDKGFMDLEINKILDGLKANGHGAKFDNGTTIFIIDDAIVDTSKEGSASYTWDKSGNRVKHRRIRVTVKDGKRSEEFLRFVYKSF